MKKLSLLIGTGMVMFSLLSVPVYAQGDPGYEEEPEQEVLLENPEPEKEDDHTPISYDGTGTVIDDIENGSKHFYTIATDAGNVFYLIVDLDKESNNVYFLDTTKERDLLALAEKAEEEAELPPDSTSESTVLKLSNSLYTVAIVFLILYILVLASKRTIPSPQQALELVYAGHRKEQKRSCGYRRAQG